MMRGRCAAILSAIEPGEDKKDGNGFERTQLVFMNTFTRRSYGTVPTRATAKLIVINKGGLNMSIPAHSAPYPGPRKPA